MGCCVNGNSEIKSFEIKFSKKNNHEKSQEFVDVSLDSEEEEMKKVKEWIACKSSVSRTFAESTVFMSGMHKSERKLSYHYKSSSMVDSFIVSLSSFK